MCSELGVGDAKVVRGLSNEVTVEGYTALECHLYISLEPSWSQKNIDCLSSDVTGFNAHNFANDVYPECKKVSEVVKRPVEGDRIVKDIFGDSYCNYHQFLSPVYAILDH